ncbi:MULTISPECIES: nodulation protein NfeD [Caldimonas]|uniref:NfeD family protein n=1 Tax=Caldimonas sp. TaxID=2838790 RepID=UPI00037FD5A8|nr:nodulation protein NfeD [Caldimonas manganoxidans]
MRRGLTHAQRDGAQLVVLQMDTPGGLDTSMRRIIRDILASPVPVASFVGPSGARAASAGTYILYASHIAAMAPGTNLGAATPVALGGSPEPAPPPARSGRPAQPAASGASGPAPQTGPTPTVSGQKQLSDAVAYIRSLAQMRGRNVQWAEKAVREAASLSAEEALAQGVIEFVARDLPTLLAQIDGRRLDIEGRSLTLRTAGAALVHEEPDWRIRLLAVITDPSVALILMMLGIYGLFFEFSNPGALVPGVLGGICLLLGLYALQLLPVNYAGLALIALGLAFMVAEVLMPSFGVLGLGGIVAFVLGAVILIDTEVPGFGIPLGLIAAMAVLSAAVVIGLTAMAVRSRQRAVVSGDATVIGQQARVLEVGVDEAWVEVAGERWRARSHTKLHTGQTVLVHGRDGLVLHVRPVAPLQESDHDR